MGLLAPLYALAALAIVGPIVFHLIQRRPRGNAQFSSLRFLTASPPSLTRRSRLDNWPLLLLRVLVLALLAFAFARPYLRQANFAVSTVEGRTVILAIDTSGSMQREDVWEKAIQVAEEVLDNLAKEDRVGLYTIDRQANSVVSLERDQSSTIADARNDVRAALDNLKPTWLPTKIATGLKSIADNLYARRIHDGDQSSAADTIVLISDLHQDCGIDSLQGFEWPDDIQLDIRQITPSSFNNARLSLLFDPAQPVDSETKVRIENSSEARDSIFRVAVFDSADQTLFETQTQVPPGQSQVVSLGMLPPSAQTVVLTGDSWTADNSAWLVNRQPITEQILFVGESSLPENERLDFFLSRAPLDTGRLRRIVTSVDMDALEATADDSQVIVAEPTTDLVAKASLLKDFAADGGTVILSLARPEQATEAESLLQNLFDSEQLTVRESDTQDYAMVARVDYQHPIFSPFADPKYNDFSKIRMWNHRIVTLPDAPSRTVLAWLDDDSPLLIEQRVGEGRIFVFSTGWQPAASTLALSSKFVPILQGILRLGEAPGAGQATFEAGESIALPSSGNWELRDAGGKVVSQRAGQTPGGTLELPSPGKFTLSSVDTQWEVACSVPLSESRIAAMPPELVEQFGITTAQLPSEAVRRESAEQLKVEQLESSQRLWQWLIAAGVFLLAIESVWVGLAKRSATASVA